VVPLEIRLREQWGKGGKLSAKGVFKVEKGMSVKGLEKKKK